MADQRGRTGGLPHDVRASDADGAGERGAVDIVPHAAADGKGITGLHDDESGRRNRLQED